MAFGLKNLGVHNPPQPEELKMDANFMRLKAMSARMDLVDHALKHNHDAFSAFFMGLPVPAWIKRSDGTMVLSNEAYYRAYGIAPEEYVEAKDAQHWREGDADGFSQLDREAAETGGLALGIESILNKSTGKLEHLFVAKWPADRDRLGRVTEVAGMVLASVPGGAGANEPGK